MIEVPSTHQEWDDAGVKSVQNYWYHRGPDWYQIGDTNLDHFHLFQTLDTSLAPISLQASLSFGKTSSLWTLLDSTSNTECMYLS